MNKTLIATVVLSCITQGYADDINAGNHPVGCNPEITCIVGAQKVPGVPGQYMMPHQSQATFAVTINPEEINPEKIENVVPDWVSKGGACTTPGLQTNVTSAAAGIASLAVKKKIDQQLDIERKIMIAVKSSN